MTTSLLLQDQSNLYKDKLPISSQKSKNDMWVNVTMESVMNIVYISPVIL